MTPAPAARATPAGDEIVERLEQALRISPADETELVWVSSRHDGAATGKSRRERVQASSSLTVRVLDHGRLGLHRAGGLGASDLEFAIRQAVAHSRVREPLSGLPHLPAEHSPCPPTEPLFDAAIAALQPQEARRWLEERMGAARGQLDWVEAEVVVVNSRGIRRHATVTAAELTVRVGGGPEGGLARRAARRLEALAATSLVEAAAARAARGAIARWEGSEGPTPVVLAPEAARALIDVVNRFAFSASSYASGDSFLREHLGIQVFDRSCHLRDDGSDPRTLAFPFDLEGTAKRGVDLIQEGTPRTPALDQRQAAVLGLPPTGHAIGGNDALAQNLILMPGQASEAELLAAAEGGLWIGGIEPIECFEPQRLRVRACLRGVRRIREGRRAEPLHDLLWHGSLLRVISNLLGIGDELETGWLADRGVFGGCACPAVGLAAVQGLTALPPTQPSERSQRRRTRSTV